MSASLEDKTISQELYSEKGCIINFEETYMHTFAE